MTNRCNFACEFCPDSIMSRKRGNMKFQILARALDEISEEKLTETVLFHLMGEPLLYPDLDKAVRYAGKKGLKVCLTTNGWLMTDEILVKLLKEKIDHIIFSVQTPDERSFKLRGVEVEFAEYLERITLSIAKTLGDNANTKVTLSFLVTPFKNILLPSNKMSIIEKREDLYRHFSFWLKEIIRQGIGLDMGIMTKINNRLKQIRPHIKKLNMLGWDRLKITDNFMLETRLLGDWVHPGLYSDRIKRAGFGSCEGLTGHFGILWNGDLVFCCVDFDGKTAFGNLEHTGIKDAFGKEEIQRIIKGFKRLRILHPYCQRCLGDVSLRNSLVRQCGSILYFKFYRPWWEMKRAHSPSLIK